MRKIYDKAWKRLAMKITSEAIVLMKADMGVSTSPIDCSVCCYMTDRGVLLSYNADDGMNCECRALSMCAKYVNIASNYNSGKWKTFLCIRRMQEHIKELKA